MLKIFIFIKILYIYKKFTKKKYFLKTLKKYIYKIIDTTFQKNLLFYFFS